MTLEKFLRLELPDQFNFRSAEYFLGLFVVAVSEFTCFRNVTASTISDFRINNATDTELTSSVNIFITNKNSYSRMTKD